MTVCTVAEIQADRSVKLCFHTSHNVPRDANAKEHRTAAHWPNPFRYAGFVARSLGSPFTFPARSRR